MYECMWQKQLLLFTSIVALVLFNVVIIIIIIPVWTLFIITYNVIITCMMHACMMCVWFSADRAQSCQVIGPNIFI